MDYIIYWKSNITGATGNGKRLSYEVAQKHVKYANKKYPELNHWVQKV